MSTARWTIELTGTTDISTKVVRGATRVSDGTTLTFPGSTVATPRLHEALIKAVLAVLNDAAAGN